MLHHEHAIGDLGDHAEIMGDEQHASVVAVLDVLDQRQDLRLGGDVERRGRLVRDEKGRFESERCRDHDPLALAAGELMREALDQPFRIGQADVVHHLEDAGAPGARRHVGVDLQDFLDLLADPDHGVERRERLLEDHRHARSTKVAKLGRRFFEQRLTGEVDRTGRRRELAFRKKAHHRMGGHRLAGAAFADHADDFFPVDLKVDLLDRILAISTLRQADGQPRGCRERALPRSCRRPLGEAWVEGIAQAIAEHVHGQHRQRQKDAGEQDGVGVDAKQ